MLYTAIKTHVLDSDNLQSELSEIMIYGKTLGECSPKPFILNNVQMWGLRHLLTCPKCSVDVASLIRDMSDIKEVNLSAPPFK
jgi:hypothetical protein